MVDKIVVNPDETKKIAAVPGKDLVTLITCTPLGINTQRILVTGERVVPTPAADKSLRGKKPDVPRFPWWVLGCLGSLCVVGGYIWWAGLPIKKKKKEDEEDSEKDKKEDSAKIREDREDSAKTREDREDSAKDREDIEDSREDSREDRDKYREDREDSREDSEKTREDSAASNAIRSAELEREEARAIANRPKKRPKVKKSSLRKKRKHGDRGDKTLDWLIDILGL